MIRLLRSRGLLCSSSLLLLFCCVPASARADGCSAHMARVKELGAALRVIKNPATPASKRSRHESKAAAAEAWLKGHAGQCDLVARARPVAHLAPYADLAAEDAAQAQEGLLYADLAVRGLLPDDTVCFIASRTIPGAGRKPGLCFAAQDKGATATTLQSLAKGWCQARRASQTSRNFAIETNKLAEMFHWDGAPSGFPERVLDHWARITCPETL